MQQLRIFVLKIWRISCANALALGGCLSVIFFVEADTYNLAIALTIISLVIFYFASYRDFGELDEHSISEQFNIQQFVSRIWKISLDNVLWTFAALTYIFFVTGKQILYMVLITLVSFIMMYIDAYRTMVAEEHEAHAEVAVAE